MKGMVHPKNKNSLYYLLTNMLTADQIFLQVIYGSSHLTHQQVQSVDCNFFLS